MGDDAIYCICGGEMEFEDCPECGGDGCIYVGDDLEAFTDYEACTVCAGEGGWLTCLLVGTAQHIAAIEAERAAV
ncbi:MAG: hypothetical protein ACXWP0_01315 [Ktedonobacterales bacterium]